MKCACIAAVRYGTPTALLMAAVAYLRARLSAGALVTTLLVAAGGPLFADASHPVCVTKQHDCAQTAKIVKCCCGEQDASRTDSAPVQPRVELRVNMAATPVLPNIAPIVIASATPGLVQTSPPRSCLLDLPTLFVTFLI